MLGGQHCHAGAECSQARTTGRHKALFSRVPTDFSSNAHQRIGGNLTGASNASQSGLPQGRLSRQQAGSGMPQGAVNERSCPGNRCFDRLTHRVLIQALQPRSPRGHEPPGNPTPRRHCCRPAIVESALWEGEPAACSAAGVTTQSRTVPHRLLDTQDAEQMF